MPKVHTVENFISGVEKDPFDGRDFSAGAIYTALGATTNPKTLDLRGDLPSVRNQGSRGTCAAHAGSTIKEYQERQDTGYRGKFSPEFIYFYRANKPNTGMFSRDVMKILAERGCCTEATLPYQSKEANAATEIPKAAETEALGYKIAEYARVNTIEELKTALYQNGVCYISFPVYDTRPEFWRKKTPDSKLVGGHAVCVVGYDDRGFIIRNSWGTSFGENGYVWYPYNDFGQHWDIWTAIDSRGSPKPPPEEVKCCTVC